MELKEMISAVQNDRIQFLTMRPPGARFFTLDRQVRVTAPPELVKLSSIGDVAVLEELVGLLGIPERAWAAEVMLAAMTGVEADIVNSYRGSPEEWMETLGRTGPVRWSEWLNENRSRLIWDPAAGRFTLR